MQHRGRQLTSDNGQRSIVTTVHECNPSTRLDPQTLDVLFTHIQINRHRPKQAIRQAIRIDHTACWEVLDIELMGVKKGGDVRYVIFLIEKSLKGTKSTVHDQLEVTQLSLKASSDGNSIEKANKPYEYFSLHGDNLTVRIYLCQSDRRESGRLRQKLCTEWEVMRDEVFEDATMRRVRHGSSLEIPRTMMWGRSV
jgi:hypothetical protein